MKKNEFGNKIKANMNNYYVYEIENLINGKRYIGKRHCHCPIEEDTYMGSGILIKRAINKYGIDNFTKRVLAICNSDDEAYLKEKELIESFNAQLSVRYYNLAGGGSGGRHGVSYSIKNPIILDHQEYIKEIEENCFTKTDCHSRFKIIYYIEYLLLKNINKDSILKRIKSMATSYFDGWTSEDINEEIEYIYNQVFQKVKNNRDDVLKNHQNISISLYYSELQRIAELGDRWNIRYMFAALVIYKFLCKYKNNQVEYLRNGDYVSFEESSIFKMAGVRTRSQRDAIWKTLKEKGYIDITADNTFMPLIHKNEKEDVYINTSNYSEIYLCLNYFNKDENVTLCQKCGCPITQNKNRTRKYCDYCAKYSKKEFDLKESICVDCGKNFYISQKGRNSIRCYDCQKVHRREMQKLSINKLRAKSRKAFS